MAEIFTRTYDDGKVVDSMLNPDRLDVLYEKIRDIHKKEFPDWRIPQLFQQLAAWDNKFFYEWRTDEQFIEKLQEFGDYLTQKFGPSELFDKEDFDPEKPILTQEKPCTENP
jgi:hypothetical protein